MLLTLVNGMGLSLTSLTQTNVDQALTYRSITPIITTSRYDPDRRWWLDGALVGFV